MTDKTSSEHLVNALGGLPKDFRNAFWNPCQDSRRLETRSEWYNQLAGIYPAELD